MAGHDATPGTWDSMIPYMLQNVSPAGRELLHRETQPTQPAQPTSQFYLISAAELEGWTIQFLTSLADTPSWENTVSLVNEHHQTLAHLAVLFRYTTLLEKVAQWGIDVDVQDVNGFTALHCAYLCGDLDSVGVLKGYGADEDIQDTLGRRPLDMYIPSMNDPGRASPLSDHTSSSAQIPTAGEEDWERVSMASPQPGSLSDHEITMDHPASRRQPLHTRESTTSSRIIPASISTPSPACSNSFVADDGGRTKGVGELNLSDPSIFLEHTPSSTHVSDLSVVTFQYARSEEQELKKTSDESNWHCNQDIQPTSSRKNSPNESGDRDSPGEYKWCKSGSVYSIHHIRLLLQQVHLLAASVSIQILRHQRHPLFFSRLPPRTNVEPKSKLSTHNQSCLFLNRLSRL